MDSRFLRVRKVTKNYIILILYNILIVGRCLCQTYEDTIIIETHDYNSIFNIKMKSTYAGIDSIINGIIFHKMKQVNTLNETKYEYVGYKDSIVYRIYLGEGLILKSYPLYPIFNKEIYTNFDEIGKTDFTLESISCALTVEQITKKELMQLTSFDYLQVIYIKPGYGWVAIALEGKVIWWDVDFFK